LVEVLLALTICGIVLVAINAVFATAVRLRERTTAAVDRTLPVERALDKLRRDLKSAVGPGGFFAGDFKCNAQSMGTSMGLSSGASSGLDFYTATGIITQNTPWGDIQEVYYQLVPAGSSGNGNSGTSSSSKGLGQDLVRYGNRDQLATTTPAPESVLLMSDIESVNFECYDGQEWVNTWDTSNGNTNLPNAVRITIQAATDRNETSIRPSPIEIIVPLGTQTRTNVVQNPNNPAL
jgi:type II secretory pathway pseudopilin PulG